jgi:glycosyltransferase involved in cell wall biosynthesis
MGGVETHVYEVSRRLARAGIEVTVLTTDPSRDLPADEEAEGVKIRRVAAWPRTQDYYLSPGIYRTIMRGSWDIIHCQCYHTLVTPLAMLAAWKSRTPYVLTFHSGGHSSGLRRALRGVQRWLLRPLLARADRLIGVSRFEARFFQRKLKLPAHMFTVIQNGSHLPEVPQDHAPGKAGGTLILSVGRLERYKGHHRILSAFPHILSHYPDARLRIVGVGPYEQKLRQLALKLRVANRVEIGSIPPSDRQGMAALLSKASIVTLLSDYEAHPVSAMEALALGRPMLVTDTSGLRELAQRGLVRSIPLKSSAEEIARAVVKELRDPLARPEVQLPTWEGCTARLLSLYQEITGHVRANSRSVAHYG